MSYMVLFGENKTVWAIQKKLKKVIGGLYIKMRFIANVKLNSYLHIILQFNIAEYTNIIWYVLESIKLSKRNRSCKEWEKKYK